MERVCVQCGKLKDETEFSWKLRGKKLTARCHGCRRENYHENPRRALQQSKEYYYNNKDSVLLKSRERYKKNIKKVLLSSAKKRAKRDGVPFELTEEDIQIPIKCPVLGIKLVIAKGTVSGNSITLDRIVGKKGYVKSNVLVVSQKANTIKNNATILELNRVARFYKKLEQKELWQAFALAVTWWDQNN